MCNDRIFITFLKSDITLEDFKTNLKTICGLNQVSNKQGYFTIHLLYFPFSSHKYLIFFSEKHSALTVKDGFGALDVKDANVYIVELLFINDAINCPISNAIVTILGYQLHTVAIVARTLEVT